MVRYWRNKRRFTYGCQERYCKSSQRRNQGYSDERVTTRVGTQDRNATVLDVIIEHIEEPVLQCILFAYDIVVIGESREEIKERFKRDGCNRGVLWVLSVTKGTECWGMKSQQENKLNVTEMRMLYLMSGYTRQDRNRNECIIKVAPLVEKMVETRRRWFRHV
ncbi:hypothetical protein CR513_35073, partial [Mucuna pruriens]